MRAMSKDTTKVDGIEVFMSAKDIQEHESDIIRINKEISEGLKDTNFSHLDFCDVSAGGIQVRLFHKEVKGYCCTHTTLHYSWDNVNEVIEDSIAQFKEFDTPEKVFDYNHFITQGEKYGWD